MPYQNPLRFLDPNYDPLDELLQQYQQDPEVQLRRQGLLPPAIREPAQPRAPAAFPPFETPEETQSALKSVLGTTMGGLQYVAETLDKPGRAVRGLLGGKPSELMNLIPFSDTLGLTDPQQAVSGRDILENAGILDKNTPGLDWGDVAGFAADVVTDPLMYVGPGALNAAGKLAAKSGKLAQAGGKVAGRALTPATELAEAALKAGQLAPTWESGIRAGQRGLVGLGVPGVPSLQTVLGTGERAAEFAGKYVDPMLDYLKYGNPVGRGMNRLFNRDAGDLAQGISQKLHGEQYIPQREQQMEKALRPLQEQLTSLSKPNEATGWWLDEAHQKAMRAGAEFANDEPKLAGVVDEIGNGTNGWQGTLGAAAKVGQTLHQATTKMIPELNDLGVRGSELADDLVTYLARSHRPDEWVGVLRNLASGVRSKDKLFERLDFLKGWEGGTNQINDVIKEPWLHYDKFKDAAEEVAKMLPGADAEQQAAKFVAWARSLPQKFKPTPDGAGEVANFFNVDPITDLIMRTRTHVRQVSDANFKHELIRRTAQKFEGGAIPEGYTGVVDALNNPKIADLPFNVIEADPLTGKTIFTGGGQATAARNLGLNPNDVEIISQRGPAGTFGSVHQVKGLSEYAIPNEIAADLGRVAKIWDSPDALKPILEAYDKGLGLWKQTATQIWPGFHVRNAVSGLYYNLAGGAYYNGAGGMPDVWTPVADAWKLLRGQPIDDARALQMGFKNADDVMTSLRTTGVLKPGGTQTAEAVAGEGIKFDEVSHATPATLRESIRDNLVRPVGQAAGRFLKQGGNALTGGGLASAKGALGGAVDTADAIITAARKTGSFTEDMLRVAHFLGAKAQGLDDLAAAASVKKWLFDYGDLTQFEKQVMKRLMPFYCVPEESEALTRDGWKTHHDLRVGEELLTYSMERDCYEWQPCLDVATFEHDGELMTWENTHHRLRFTPNHRWVVTLPDRTITRRYGTYFYPRERLVVTGDELNTSHSFKVASEYHGTEQSLLTPEQARLLGWAMTDGYWRRRGGHTELVIYQHPKKFLGEVMAVAGGKPRKPHPETGVVCVPVLKERVDEIKEFLDTPKLVSVITRLSRPSLEAMYDAMYKGDGTVSEKRLGDFIAAQDLDIKRGIVVLATLLGKRSVPNARGVCVSHTRGMRVACGKLGMEHYCGIVWCPRTANGTWVMRQGRLVTITGNTFARNNIPLVLRQLVEHPGGFEAQTIRAVNSPREQGGFVPPYISQGLAIPIPGGEGARYLTGLGLPIESAFDPFSSGPTALQSVQHNLEGVISQSSPLLKLGYTAASGRDPFTGRPLTELYPYPTSSIGINAAENAFLGTPTARVRTLFDERKEPWARALNTLTGARVTDISGGPERAMQLVGRRADEALLKEDPLVKQYTEFYVPKENLGLVTQQTRDRVRLRETLVRLGKQQVEERRKNGLVGSGAI